MEKVCGKCLRETSFIAQKCIHCGARSKLIDKPIKIEKKLRQKKK